jgi:stage II sporulation protein M
MVLFDFYKNLLIENRGWIRLVSIWFVLAAIAGVVTFFYYPQLLEQIIAVFEEKFGPDQALDMNMVWDLFKNNLTASAIALFGGIILGIAPFTVSVTNGFILGFIVTSLLRLGDTSFWDSLLFLFLVPHGIIELPTFLIAAAFGLRLGTRYLKDSSHGNRLGMLGQDLKAAFLILPLIVVALVIAAFLEVYVSGKLIS